ncbi:hemerythrin domain-containing protein [Magnetovibrio sp.]|uniref:bacteriohemerythrin n=1 Tax=Magnetovibrio sp. TaxID=2024836 RepID=UPI002F94B59B
MNISLLDTFITGHPVVDAEHRKIVDSINGVSQAVSAGEYERCSTLLDEFLQICIDHFDSEESLLSELGYPGLADHTAFHRELILKAKSVKVLCMDRTRPDSIQRCFDEMATLLIEDVVKGDLQFVSFLVEKGVVDQRTSVHTPS